MMNWMHWPNRLIGNGILAVLLSCPVVASETLPELLMSNDPQTLATWAQRYEHGEGVGRDIDTAVHLYCRAARAGHVESQYQLGWLYANARGVARDDGLAGAWFHLAAEQGDVYAQRMLRFFDLPESPIEPPDCILTDGSSVDGPDAAPPQYQQIVDWVERLSPGFKLDPTLVLAVIQVESNFNPQALSPKNAQGLMQLIPATAERFGVSDVWNPEDNIRGGMAYLRWLLDHFEGDITLALAGYNAGEGAVARHGGIPPYAETQAYVQKVTRLLSR
jgi:hypothetical protein